MLVAVLYNVVLPETYANIPWGRLTILRSAELGISKLGFGPNVDSPRGDWLESPQRGTN